MSSVVKWKSSLVYWFTVAETHGTYYLDMINLSPMPRGRHWLDSDWTLSGQWLDTAWTLRECDEISIDHCVSLVALLSSLHDVGYANKQTHRGNYRQRSDVVHSEEISSPPATNISVMRKVINNPPTWLVVTMATAGAYMQIDSSLSAEVNSVCMNYWSYLIYTRIMCRNTVSAEGERNKA